LDELLGGGDARLEGFLLVDQQGDELGRADLAAADFRELDPPVLKRPGDELFGVLHRPHSHDGEPAQVRLDEERLAVGVADDADAAPALELRHLGVELGPELVVLDAVNDPGEPVAAVDGQPAALGPEVGVIVRAVEKVADAVAL
jgi:hypothetical protein